jgi:hypothetical protein
MLSDYLVMEKMKTKSRKPPVASAKAKRLSARKPPVASASEAVLAIKDCDAAPAAPAAAAPAAASLAKTSPKEDAEPKAEASVAETTPDEVAAPQAKRRHIGKSAPGACEERATAPVVAIAAAAPRACEGVAAAPVVATAAAAPAVAVLEHSTAALWTLTPPMKKARAFAVVTSADRGFEIVKRIRPKPSVNHEKTRSQFLVRSGDLKLKSETFQYINPETMAQAEADARKLHATWVDLWSRRP